MLESDRHFKRWCGGVEDVPHTVIITKKMYPNLECRSSSGMIIGGCWHEKRCKVCNMFLGLLRERDCPVLN